MVKGKLGVLPDAASEGNDIRNFYHARYVTYQKSGNEKDTLDGQSQKRHIP